MKIVVHSTEMRPKNTWASFIKYLHGSIKLNGTNNKKNAHNYADGTEVYLNLSGSDHSPIDSLCKHTEQISDWMRMNYFHLHY